MRAVPARSVSASRRSPSVTRSASAAQAASVASTRQVTFASLASIRPCARRKDKDSQLGVHTNWNS